MPATYKGKPAYGLDGPPCPERSTLDQRTPPGQLSQQRMCMKCGRVTARTDDNDLPWCGGEPR